MSKWHGMIGFDEGKKEVKPGIFKASIVEKPYFGDVLRNTRSLQASSAGINDDVNIANQISIVADPYARNHIYSMRYIEFQGERWKVSSVDASQPPRLTLQIGGLWNGS